MKNWLITLGILVLICSGVLGVTIRVNVDSFSEARDKVIEWKDEVFIPLVERGLTVE